MPVACTCGSSAISSAKLTTLAGTPAARNVRHPFGGGALEQALLDLARARPRCGARFSGSAASKSGAVGVVVHAEDAADGVAVLLREGAEDERALRRCGSRRSRGGARRSAAPGPCACAAISS